MESVLGRSLRERAVEIRQQQAWKTQGRDERALVGTMIEQAVAL